MKCTLILFNSIEIIQFSFISFFQILNHNILVALAVNFPADFTAEVHVAVDKFLAAVAAALADKYR